MGAQTGSSWRGRATLAPRMATFPATFPGTVDKSVCRAKRAGVFAGRFYKATGGEGSFSPPPHRRVGKLQVGDENSMYALSLKTTLPS